MPDETTATNIAPVEAPTEPTAAPEDAPAQEPEGTATETAESSVETPRDDNLPIVEEPIEDRTPPPEAPPEESTAPELPETIKVGEEDVPLQELIDSRTKLKEAQPHLEKLEEYQRIQSSAQTLLQRIISEPTKVILDAFTAATQDPELAKKEALKHFGKFIDEQWQWEQLPESERQAIELKNKLKTTEEKLEEYRQKEAEEKRLKEESDAFSSLHREVDEILPETKLPNAPKIKRSIAEVLYVARRQGHKITALEAANYVKEELRKQFDERAAELDKEPDRLLALFPNLAKRVSKANVDQVRRNLSQRNGPAGATTPRSEEKKTPPVKIYRDFEDLLNR